MAAVALSVAGGGKAFDRGDEQHVAFRDVDLDLVSGEILALLGPSGCGKSTLLRSIAGLEQLDEGSIRIGDGLDPEHAVGIAFQQPSLLPWLSVADNVGLGLRFGANRAAASAGVVERAIEEVGLDSCADAYPDELSGGQAQRANVARLVVTGRPILLLDEPFAALDPATRAGLQDWFVALARAHSLSVIVVTHDVSEALRLGDRVTLMSGAPGTIQRSWDVRGITADFHDPEAIDELRREIRDDYDVYRAGAPVEVARRPTTSEAMELEGARG